MIDLMHNLWPDPVERALPFPVEHFFTPQRAPDMWFGDELPPTIQDYLNEPQVKQAKAFMTFQVLQQIAQSEQRALMRNAPPKEEQKLVKKYLKQIAAQQAS
jgi:ABC-type lipoprotein release transport system permease subunit